MVGCHPITLDLCAADFFLQGERKNTYVQDESYNPITLTSHSFLTNPGLPCNHGSMGRKPIPGTQGQEECRDDAAEGSACYVHLQVRGWLGWIGWIGWWYGCFPKIGFFFSPPKSSILIVRVFPQLNYHPFWGTYPYFLETMKLWSLDS